MAQEDAADVYRLSRYYDIAFDRDVRTEVDYLEAVFQRWAGRPLTSILDIACGPGYHAREMAIRGRVAIGLDLQPEMIAYAQHASAHQPAVSWIVADMRSFSVSEPVDLAFCANSGIGHLLTTEGAVSHLRAVARALVPGGLYVVELSHPRDCHPFDYGTWTYEGERDGTHVVIEWGTNRPVADPLTQVCEVEVSVRVVEDGHERVFRERSQERHIFPPEIEALCAVSGELEVLEWHGRFDVSQPLDNTPASTVMIGVLGRRGPGTAIR